MSNHDQPSETTRDAQLSALYQRARQDEPPAPLDAAILAAAHREVAAGPLRANAPARSTRWRIPLALAATVVLGSSVVTLLRQHEAPESMTITMLEHAPSEMQMPQAQLKSAPVPQESIAEMKAALAAPAAPVVRDALKKRARLPEANRSADEVIALAQAPETEKNSQATEPRIEKIGETTAAPQAEKPSVPAAVSSQPPTSQTLRMFAAEQELPSSAIAAKVASKPKDIGAWLKEIAKLRVAGRAQESAQQLQLFKKAYPDVTEEKIATDISVYEREWRDVEKSKVAPQNIIERN